VLAIVDHRRSLATLRASGATVHRSLALIIAIFIAALGIGGLVLAVLGR
jgi:predicted membrane-bound spermidine synthase